MTSHSSHTHRPRHPPPRVWQGRPHAFWDRVRQLWRGCILREGSSDCLPTNWNDPGLFFSPENRVRVRVPEITCCPLQYRPFMVLILFYHCRGSAGSSVGWDDNHNHVTPGVHCRWQYRLSAQWQWARTRCTHTLPISPQSSMSPPGLCLFQKLCSCPCLAWIWFLWLHVYFLPLPSPGAGRSQETRVGSFTGHYFI